MGWTAGRYRGSTRKDRHKEVQTLPFAAAGVSICDDKNLHLIFRSMACFAGQEFFVIGSEMWFPGAAKYLDELVTVTHFRNENEWLGFMRSETNYSIVAIEQSSRSIPITNVEYPQNPCFIFGNEGFGLGDDILLNSDLIIEIPMNGFHPCLNVGCSASVVFYDYVRRLAQNTETSYTGKE